MDFPLIPVELKPHEESWQHCHQNSYHNLRDGHACVCRHFEKRAYLILVALTTVSACPWPPSHSLHLSARCGTRLARSVLPLRAGSTPMHIVVALVSLYLSCLFRILYTYLIVAGARLATLVLSRGAFSTAYLITDCVATHLVATL